MRRITLEINKFYELLNIGLKLNYFLVRERSIFTCSQIIFCNKIPVYAICYFSFDEIPLSLESFYFDNARGVYRITRVVCTTIVASGFVYVQLCFPSGTEIITKITREFRERGEAPRDKVIRYVAYVLTLYASY